MVSSVPMRTQVVIIGAGFGGIGLGIKLKSGGLDDFVILEKSGSVGGVWRDNTYPGAACDVPSHLYSFSFEPRADWPDKYASGADILEYLAHCMRKHSLERHIRFHAEVTEARWDAEVARWVVRTRDGAVLETQSLVTATGQLSRPSRPHFPGLESFSGPVFHSSEWRHDYDLSGKNVAVIGTGASAIQFVPAIAPLVKTLSVFQRSAAYVLPKPDKAYRRWQRFLFERVWGALRLSRAFTYLSHEMVAFAFVYWPAALRVKRRAFLRHLYAGVKNPERRRALVPNYRLGCKRILLSNDFYPAMDRPNVELVTDPIKQITHDAVVTMDGTARKVDCIIFATGFAATDFLIPIKITGRGGHDLHKAWQDGAEAHLGITVKGLPNFFMLYGPNTNLAHNSIVYMIECQIRYVMACLKRLQRDNIRTIEVKQEAHDRSNMLVQRRLKGSVWSKGCTSWYLTSMGKNTSIWPGYTLEFRLRTRAPNWIDYAVD